MSRSFCFAFAALLFLIGYNPAPAQDATPATPPASSTPSTDDVVKLTEENAELKKEVADAKQTIAQLQAQLAQAGQKPTTTADTSTPATDTNAAPAGPLKALPLDATNTTADASAPGAPAAEAGPSRSYTVVKGDSLWKIAHKMYPHDTLNGEDKIREANKDVFNGKFLQPGQVLVVPQ